MQLTSTAFLFFFLPLSLPLMLLAPKAHRRLSLSVLSILWYVLANLNHLFGIIHIVGLVALTILFAYLPAPRSIKAAKFRSIFLIAVALLSFIGARVAVEYINTNYPYPTGLLLVTLGVVSYAMDHARGDVIRPRNPLELIGYLLFFPTLMVGPVLRSKQYFDLTEDLSFQAPLMTEGIRLYMLGYVKRLAAAAVLMRSLQDLLRHSSIIFSPLIFLLLLVLSYLFFYFYISGGADLARGVCAIYGIRLPRDRTHVLTSPTPDRMLYGTMLSFHNYLLDYIHFPLYHKKENGKQRLLSLLLIYCITILVFRTRAELLLLGLPILIFSLLCEFTPVRGLITAKHRWRWLLSPLSALLCSFFTLALLLPVPTDIFPLLAHAFTFQGHYPTHYIWGAIQDANYLGLLVALLCLLLPWGRLRNWLLRRSGARTRLCLSVCEITLLFASFVLTAIYFLPQFPSYAEYASSILRM